MSRRFLNGRAAAAACICALLPCTAASAQEPASETDNDALIEELVVRAHPLSAENLAQPVSTLRGKALERALSPSIGETLRHLPGVHATSFGQAVGRPVIRGLGGTRVKTMEDRIDSMDVSVSSPDHLTTIEPFTADSIEVLKGPTTLLYGTGAIGGVVDVHTGRIPHEVPETLAAKGELRAADNANRKTGAVRVDGGGGPLAFHLDAFYRDADEYDIPGFAESSALRALEALEGEDEGAEEEQEAFGTLPGSQMEVRGGAFGLSAIGERGFVGVSVSKYRAEYGLPGGHGHEHEDELLPGAEAEEEEEGNPILDLDQTRVDVEAGVEAPFAGVRSVNFRLGINDYEHTEFEGNGETGTVFANEALEGRVELVHELGASYEGAMGLQFSTREFSAIGEEAFVQPVDTQSVGLFYVGRRDFGDTSFEFGGRYEQVEHDPDTARSRDFDLGAVSLGVTRPLSDHWTISGQLDYSTRAPVAEELYSDGPHLATQSYEIGDPALDEERATNVSASLSYEAETLSVVLNAFYSDFGDFIYEAAAGFELDELPVLQWRQDNATFRGFEVDVGWDALRFDQGMLTFNVGFDLVRAQLDSGENRNLPRIPPRRYRLGTILRWQGLLAEVEWSRVDAQRDTAFGELPTDAYHDLRVHLGYEMSLGDNRLELFLTGRNLTDDEQRYHTSFIKDFAPQPGRTVEAGVIVRL